MNKEKLNVARNVQIAIGFAKSQGLSALWLGILRSIGAAFGIMGAYLYSLIETHSSARKSGFIGLTAQHLALYICIISIWLPGSPFDPITYFREITFAIWWQQLKDSFAFVRDKNENETGPNDIDWSTWTSDGHSIISAFTLLIGIAVARLGLYMADLSISQIMQEKVPERERNTVFGVQDSIAQFFSMLKVVDYEEKIEVANSNAEKNHNESGNVSVKANESTREHISASSDMQ
uniref:Solute carrier family 40 member n=1 Tax=Brugia malayi TaxID=6279 RepID=A0A0H5S5K5_BRUMA|nr:BMA-FPN-1.1 [Brugia malayi]